MDALKLSGIRQIAGRKGEQGVADARKKHYKVDERATIGKSCKINAVQDSGKGPIKLAHATSHFARARLHFLQPPVNHEISLSQYRKLNQPHGVSQPRHQTAGKDPESRTGLHIQYEEVVLKTDSADDRERTESWLIKAS